MNTDASNSPVLRTPNGHHIKPSNTLAEENSIIANLVDAVFVSQVFASKTNYRPAMLEKCANAVAQLALASNNTFWRPFTPKEQGPHPGGVDYREDSDATSRRWRRKVFRKRHTGQRTEHKSRE